MSSASKPTSPRILDSSNLAFLAPQVDSPAQPSPSTFVKSKFQNNAMIDDVQFSSGSSESIS